MLINHYDLNHMNIQNFNYHLSGTSQLIKCIFLPNNIQIKINTSIRTFFYNRNK